MSNLNNNLMEDFNFLSKLIVGIGEVAEITGLPTRQIRYWEEKGIIHSIQGGEAKNRRFDYFQIKKLLLIKELMDEGYTLGAAAKKIEQRMQGLNEALSKLKHKSNE